MDQGATIMDALVEACQARTRPIIITALALVAGSSVILFDPIFQGMAISLMFGTVVSTLLTLLVIPLGCISGRRAFCPASLTGSGALVCDDGNDHGHGRPAAVRNSVGQRRRPGPISTGLGYAGLYLQALALSLLKGLRDLLKAALKLFRRLFRRHRAAPVPPPPAAPTTPAAPDTPATDEPGDSTEPMQSAGVTESNAVQNKKSRAALPATAKTGAADGEDTVDKPVTKRVRKTAAKPRTRTAATEQGRKTADKGARSSASRASKSKTKADEGEGKVATKVAPSKERATTSGRSSRTRRGIRLKSAEQATDSKNDEGKE